jgi:hypothetical protein
LKLPPLRWLVSRATDGLAPTHRSNYPRPPARRPPGLSANSALSRGSSHRCTR